MCVRKMKTMIAAMAAAMASAMSFAATVVYENDFATRRSEVAPPGSVWATYEYDKGGPVAYDYDTTSSFSRYTGMYPWQGTGSGTVSFSQQDGWIKKYRGTGNRYVNRGRTSITDEDDPAVVYSAKDNSSTGALFQTVLILHPLRNVFTNGIIKAQFDIRQPDSPDNVSKFAWFRLVTEQNMKNDNTNWDHFPIEAGLSAGRWTAAWRKDGGSDGERQLNTLISSVQELNWYRCVITCNLDEQTSDVAVYELGLSRISMDAVPPGAAKASRTGLLFRKNLDATTGGINGIGLRFAYTDTNGYYGEEGFNTNAAYMCDNIKVSWKAPGAASFMDCYRNDFSKSMRRTIDGSSELVHNYVQTEADETSTFTYGSELVRASNVLNSTKPYPPAASEGLSAGNALQKPGVDGWRFGGRKNMTGPIVVTTNGSNRVGLMTRYCQCLQPMCEDITNGIVKMECDMRMPQTWNARQTTLFLTSNRGYDTEHSFGLYNYLGVGLSPADGSLGATYSIANSTPTVLACETGSGKEAVYNPSWASKFTALEWYRIQIFVDLDATNYWYHVYDIGASAPSNPDSYADSTDTANAIVSSEKIGFYVSSNPTTQDNPILRHGYGIGAYGVLNWQNPTSAANAMYFDNVRLWTTNAVSGGWDLVFKNDFSTTVRNIRRKSVKLLNSSYLDRPEYGEDGWASTPTYNVSPRVAGENAALYSGDDYVALVHPIGCNVKSGLLHVQYDVRLPVFWPSSPNYFRFQLGNGTLASASTWKVNAYRCGSHRTIRADFQVNSAADSTTGVKNKTDIVVQDGTGVGGDGTTLKEQLGSSYIGHWIRMRIEANMSNKTYSILAYDMGTEQPTLAAADGTLLKSWDGLHFNFNDPISYLYIMTGKTTSFAPWRSDMPGALLVANIRITHEKPGTMVTLK